MPRRVLDDLRRPNIGAALAILDKAPVNQISVVGAFAEGDADTLTRMLVSAVDQQENHDSVWFHSLSKGRLIALLMGVLKPLVWLRNQGQADLTPRTVRQYIRIPAIIDLANDLKMPQELKDAARNYLYSIPRFQAELGAEQMKVAQDHHGLLEGFVGRVLDRL
jgi:hypothetical protein